MATVPDLRRGARRGVCLLPGGGPGFIAPVTTNILGGAYAGIP